MMPETSKQEVDKLLEEQPPIFVPADEARVAQMATNHALREVSQSLGRVATRLEGQDDKLGRVGDALHSIDKRMALIEASQTAKDNEWRKDVERLDKDLSGVKERVDSLCAAEAKRQGAISLYDFMLKSWPAIVGIGGVVAAIAAIKGV